MNSAVTKFVPLDQMEQRLTSYALNEFLGLSIPPRSYVLDPIIPTQELAMLYAQRGVGKTHVGIGISLAVAAGGSEMEGAGVKAGSLRRW